MLTVFTDTSHFMKAEASRAISTSLSHRRQTA